MPRPPKNSLRVLAVVLASACAAAGCAASKHSTAASSRPALAIGPSTSAVRSTATTTAAPSSSHASTRPRPTPTSTPRPSPTTKAPVPQPSVHPVIVIDPGHSRTISAIDPRTGLNVSDYENEPEMRDVFAVALIVRRKLVAAGYRVVLTKRTVGTRASLGRRAAIANNAHAALALSIHDQAGSNGGLPFHAANNIVYYQSVGDYRETPNGRKVYFTNRRVAAISRRYGHIFQSVRRRVEHHYVAVQGNVGYNLGSRGLAPGNIWLVQLLSHVPWIYNEAGGNSPGMSGLNSADKHTYANGLVAAVERCVPIPH